MSNKPEAETSRLIPNAFQHPNILIDRLAYYLTPEENVVLDKAVREILGWRNKIESRKAAVSLSVFVDGKTSKETGERVCLGCGLGRNTVRRALVALDEFRILVKVGKPTRDGQLYWLQDDDTAIDWAELESRRAELDQQNLAKTNKATDASLKSLKRRGVTSHVTEGVTSHVTEGVTSHVTEGVTSHVTEGVTSHVTEGVTSHVTEGVTSHVTEGVTSHVNKETQKKTKEKDLNYNNSSSSEIDLWQLAQRRIQQQSTVTRATFDQCIAPVKALPRQNGAFRLAFVIEPNPALVEKIIKPVLISLDPTIKEIEVIIQ